MREADTMHNPVGYSGIFLSGYTGRQSSLVKDHPTTLTEDDSRWYVVTRELRDYDDSTCIILHTELFLRHSWADRYGRSVSRYRLTVNDMPVPIEAIESSFAWMNTTAKPDEHRLITPAGILIDHSDHRSRNRYRDHTTWRNEKFWLADEKEYVFKSRR